MPVRCVAFDADDTLWDFTGAMRRGLALALEVLAEVHPAVAAALDLPALEAAWDDAYAAYVADPRPNDRVDDLRPRSFATVLAAHGVVDADLVDRMATRYYAHRRNEVELFDEVADELARLGERYALALVSNGNTDPRRRGLPGRFDLWLAADQIGVRKPDPRIFRMAALGVGCHPSELVYVGDHPHHDVVAAQAAGCRGVWIDRAGAGPPPPGVHPDATVADLRELPSVLDRFDDEDAAALAAVGVGPHPEPWPNDDRLDPALLARGDRRNVVDRYRYWREEAIVADLATRRHPFHVAVENWRHDRNIGAVVRNANAFGAAGVHIVGRRRWNRRGAMATDRYLDVRHHDDTAGFLAWAAAEGLAVVGIDNVAGATPLETEDLPERCVLVFGQEGPGLSAEVLAAAAQVRAIAQFGSTRSINAGVASGIAMHAWARAHVSALAGPPARP